MSIQMRTELNKLKKDTEKLANNSKKVLGKMVLWELTQRTPVDTTLTVSNWLVDLNAFRAEMVTPHEMYGHDISKDVSYYVGEAIIKHAKYTDCVTISNSTYYLPLLDKGSSPQAEPNFVKHCVSDAIKEFERVNVKELLK